MRPFSSLLPAWSAVAWLAVGGHAADASSNSVEELITQLPSCALSCIVNAVSQSECALTDISCICSSERIADMSEPCVLSECTVREALETQRLQSINCGMPPRDKSGLLRRVQWSGFCLAIVAVTFRFAAKLPIWSGPDLWWDDWSILACLLICVGSNVVLTLMVDNGLGKDVWMLMPDQIDNVLKYYWASAFLYVTVMHGIKVSILLLYLRVFPTEISKWFNKACYILVGLLVASAIGFCVSNASACSPVEYNWLQWDGEHDGRCLDTKALVFASAGVNIFFDLAVFLLPLPLLVPLRISIYRKIGVYAAFLVGLFVTVCSIIRLQYLIYWGDSQNPTWDNTSLATWSTVEANWAIICACMPSMARPIKLAWKKASAIVGSYSAGSDPTLIDSRPPSVRNAGHAGADGKGFCERQAEGPARPWDDVELAEHPVTRQSSSGF